MNEKFSEKLGINEVEIGNEFEITNRALEKCSIRIYNQYKKIISEKEINLFTKDISYENEFEIGDYKFSVTVNPESTSFKFKEGETIPYLSIMYAKEANYEKIYTKNSLINPEERKLITETYRTSVKELFNMYNDGLLELAPIFQRGTNIWNNTRKSLLIESLVVNIPIPVIYCMETINKENDNIKWEVIDGVQRLTAILDFYRGKFSLDGLEYEEMLNGKKYNDLNGKDSNYDFGRVKNILDRAAVPIVLIRKESDPDIKFDVFARLNKGGVMLSEQELRNCIYRGSFNNLIKKLNKMVDVKTSIVSIGKENRGEKEEIILTYLAYISLFKLNDSNKFILNSYSGSLKTTLNDFMYKHKDDSDDKINSFEETFISIYNLYKLIFESNKKGKNTFLTYMVCFYFLLKKDKKFEEKIKKLNKIVFKGIEPKINEFAQKRTSNKDNIENRHTTLYRELLKYLNE